jgi:hypothetical protein
MACVEQDQFVCSAFVELTLEKTPSYSGSVQSFVLALPKLNITDVQPGEDVNGMTDLLALPHYINSPSSFL